MRTEVSKSGHDARPPHLSAAGLDGTSVRPTARVRPLIGVGLRSGTSNGLQPHDPYVRRFWVAAIGANAVADLLRLIKSAEKGELVRLPRQLPSLMRYNLVTVEDGRLIVSPTIPYVPKELRWRFPPSLAGEHSRWRAIKPAR